MSKIDSIDDHFKIPVFYNKYKLKLNDNIISDLELVDTIDPSGINIYSFAFKSNNCFPFVKDKVFVTDILSLRKYSF